MTTYPLAVLRVAACVLLLAVSASAVESVPRFGVFETTFTGPEKLDDPYRQVAVSVTFTGPAASGSKKIVIDAFWDGDATWRVRMCPTELGQWSWRTSSATKTLDALSGKFTCMPSRGVGFLITDPSKPNLTLRGDKPIFLMGCSGSALSDFSIKNGSFQKYIDTRAAQGFNFLYAGWLRPLADNEAGTAFTDPKRLTPNPAYFQAADQRMYYCRMKGIVPVVSMQYSGSIKQEDFVALSRYLVARYAAFDVIWTLYPEMSTPYGDPTLIRKLDPYAHPIMETFLPTVETVTTPAELDFICTRNMGADPAQLNRLVAFGKPVVNDIRLIENLTGKPAPENSHLTNDIDSIRRAAWRTVMLGAYPLYEVSGFDPAKPETVMSPGALQFSTLSEFFAQTEWWQMVWAPELLLKGDALVRARHGTECVAYLPKGGPITLDVAAIKDGLLVQWFDPRTGKIASSVQLPASPEFDSKAPDETHDWVLHISRVRQRTER